MNKTIESKKCWVSPEGKRIKWFQAVREHESAALEALRDPLVYSLRAEDWTVAHEAVCFHEKAAIEALKNSNIYLLRDSTGWTVAHEAVYWNKRAAIVAEKNHSISKVTEKTEEVSVGTVCDCTLQR